VVDTFLDDRVGVKHEDSYFDDDGQTGGGSVIIDDARGILDVLHLYHN
jgi:hypothetical protein